MPDRLRRLVKSGYCGTVLGVYVKVCLSALENPSGSSSACASFWVMDLDGVVGRAEKQRPEYGAP